MKHARLHRVAIGIAWLVTFQVILVLSGQSGAQPAKTRGVSYVLEWKRDRARSVAAHAGWEVTNDLGFAIRVTRGYLVTRGIELVPCDPRSPAASLRDGLNILFAPRPAFAGHTAVADPSALPVAQVESLLDVSTTQPATRYPGAQAYCQAHYLIARADPQATGLPADVDMVDQTLRIEGTFQRPGDTTVEPFSIVTSVANGKLFDLAQRLDTGRESAVVVVRRDLDPIFDRVDFVAMPAKRIARELLQNLIEHTEIEVRVSRDAG